MFRKSVLFSLFLLVLLVITACTPAAKTPETMMDQQPDQMMEEQTATPMAKSDDAMMEPTDAMMEDMNGTPSPDSQEVMMEPTEDMMHPTDEMVQPTQAMPDNAMDQPIPASGAEAMAPAMWMEVSFTNPVTGETFKVNDFKGKVVLVETFAQWCPTCLRQQKEMAKLHEMIGMESDLVTISLDIDPNEDENSLKAYLTKNGLDWKFAVAPSEVSREIGQLYGDQFLNPPSAPMLVIDRQGKAHPLPFGVKSAEDLQKALEPFLKAGM